MNVSPNQDDLLTALRGFLLTVLPAGVDAVAAIENRVPEPAAPNFVVMTPIAVEELATNIDTPADVRFTGAVTPQAASFTGLIEPAAPSPGVMPSGILTVASVASGTLAVGAAISGANVLPNTLVTAQLDGTPGGAGRYSVNLAQEVGSESLTAAWGLLTVSAIDYGQIAPGATVFGVGVSDQTTVGAVLSGTGGVGTYSVYPAQTVASGVMAAGAMILTRKAAFTVQLDYHALDGSALDMSRTVTITFRDPFGVNYFAGLSAPLNLIAPLYCDNARLAPFFNENQQVEYRWVSEARLQVDQSTSVPQQFADALAVQLISVSTSPFPIPP